MSASNARSVARNVFSKVPEVTLYFWVIKVLCTTVGETFADLLNTNFDLGLTNLTLIMGSLLIVALFFQFRAKRYVPSLYWLAVVLISIVGTLITDNLTDNLGVELAVTTGVFAVALTMSFAAWYRSEGTLSIHSIFTARREAFYWVVILFTFALGTAAGDLAAEALALGYLLSAVTFAALIAAVALAHRYLNLNAVIAFWFAYIVTRPLGASLGDLLAQSPDNGGLGIGTVGTSIVFLSAILATVIYLTMSKRDIIKLPQD
jgi:uncharacterized membrane-anchored protein